MTKLDTRERRATPEGVDLALRVAGPPVRLLAFGIDMVLIFVLQIGLSIVAGLFGHAGAGFFYLAMFVVVWFYPVAFELLRDGATPGKSSLGLRVVHDDGTPVSATASLIRNLLRVTDMTLGAGLISMLVSPSFQRLGDLAAGTYVVYRDDDRGDLEVSAATPLPPPFALDREEQRLVIDFAARSRRWTAERAAELGDVVEPLTGATGDAGVRRLEGMARWLLGHRGAA